MEFVNDPETILKAAAGDREAAQTVIKTNMGLVKSVCRRFEGRGVETEDLIQIGALGMIKALKAFDPERGTKFSTYAVPMMIGEIRRFMRDDGLISVSRKTKSDCAKINAFIQDFRGKNDRDPDLKEICAATGISKEDAVFALGSGQPVMSLQDGEEERDVPDFSGEDELEKSFEKEALKEAVRSLEPEERELIELRYFRGLTQTQVARLTGKTQVKVSRDEKKICQKLKKMLE
ncbi:MAG: sigma-70 family RNA polymerase sigma factor [Clostridia bacterium]|nr:sigma-70 family RNA polymerase sigma factor [Clostridia bacterium]